MLNTLQPLSHKVFPVMPDSLATYFWLGRTSCRTCCSLACSLPTSRIHIHPTHRQTVRQVNAPMRRRLHATANPTGTHLRGHADANAGQIHLGVHHSRPQLPSPPRGRVDVHRLIGGKRIFSYKYICYIFV
jgi:hypothetical protein